MVDSDIAKSVGAAAYGFLAEFLKDSAKKAEDFFVEKSVGFLPEGLDYTAYKTLKKSQTIRQLKHLIGNHPTLPIILTGIYLGSLDEKTRRSIVYASRQKIYQKYGPNGVSIMNVATTGFITGMVKWLSDYNIERSLSTQELIDSYESLLHDWKQRTIFVEGHERDETVHQQCISKMALPKEVFFMFASGSAIQGAERTVKRLKEQDAFNQFGYLDVKPTKINNSDSEKVWIFERKEIQ